MSSCTCHGQKRRKSNKDMDNNNNKRRRHSSLPGVPWTTLVEILVERNCEFTVSFIYNLYKWQNLIITLRLLSGCVKNRIMESIFDMTEATIFREAHFRPSKIYCLHVPYFYFFHGRKPAMKARWFVSCCLSSRWSKIP